MPLLLALSHWQESSVQRRAESRHRSPTPGPESSFSFSRSLCCVLEFERWLLVSLPSDWKSVLFNTNKAVPSPLQWQFAVLCCLCPFSLSVPLNKVVSLCLQQEAHLMLLSHPITYLLFSDYLLTWMGVTDAFVLCFYVCPGGGGFFVLLAHFLLFLSHCVTRWLQPPPPGLRTTAVHRMPCSLVTFWAFKKLNPLWTTICILTITVFLLKICYSFTSPSKWRGVEDNF